MYNVIMIQSEQRIQGDRARANMLTFECVKSNTLCQLGYTVSKRLQFVYYPVIVVYCRQVSTDTRRNRHNIITNRDKDSITSGHTHPYEPLNLKCFGAGGFTLPCMQNLHIGSLIAYSVANLQVRQVIVPKELLGRMKGN